MKKAYKVLKEGGLSIFKKDTWRVTRISMTYTLEESTENGVGNHDMQYPKMIWFIGSRIDLNPWIEGHGPLDVYYTWREVNFSLNGKSKEGGSLSFEIVKRETMIQS
jgi:hypothetical protein